jgi:hypothetical protein
VRRSVHDVAHDDVLDGSAATCPCGVRCAALDTNTEPTWPSVPRRGPITDALVKPVTTIVVRFVARLAIGRLVKRLERSVETGFVMIDRADPVLWTKVSQPSILELPVERRARRIP